MANRTETTTAGVTTYTITDVGSNVITVTVTQLGLNRTTTFTISNTGNVLPDGAAALATLMNQLATNQVP